MKRFRLLSLLLFHWVTVCAQPVPFTGRVQTVSGNPIAFATVLLLQASDSSVVKGSLTDTEGNYSLQAKPGTYQVSAQQLGYQKVISSQFTLVADQTATNLPVLILSETTQTLGTVTVTATKPFIEQLADRVVINVASNVVSAGGTALDVLERSPGVLVDAPNGRISLKGRDGTLVMIDGKPTYLSAHEVVNLLQNTPSTNVQTIEMITNPSAKYDAAGNAGIINIRLKRGSRTGQQTSGNLTLGAGYGQLPKTSAGLTLNHRSRDKSLSGHSSPGWNLFGTYNYDNRPRISRVKTLRQFGLPSDSLTNIRNSGEQRTDARVHTYLVGAEYTLNSRNSVGVQLNGLASDNDSRIDAHNLVYDGTGQLRQTVTMASQSTRGMHRLAANATYTYHGLSRDSLERTFTADADWSQVAIDPHDDLRTRYLSPANEPLQPDLVQRNLLPSRVWIRAAKADYSHALPHNGKIETGGKISYVTSDNTSRFETLTETGYEADPQRTNQFLYSETIAAGYINANRTWGKWSVQSGLRLEHTRSMGRSVTLNKLVNRTYSDLFPSVFVTYNPSQTHGWRASYSRRIDRPNYADLNPFIYVMDPYTYREGNPFLNPQYSHTMQAGYTYKHETTLTLGYTHTTDVITGVNDQRGDVMRVTTVNLATLKNLNLGVSFPLPITKWWTARQSADLFVNAYDADYAGQRLDYRQWSANLTTNHQFTLPYGLTAELSAFYNSPMVYGMLRTTGTGQVSAGVQKNLWHKTAVLRLNVSDLFNTMRPGGTILFGSTTLQFRNRFESRVARLTFTYNVGRRIGGKPQRPAQRSGVSDEQNRIGGQ